MTYINETLAITYSLTALESEAKVVRVDGNVLWMHVLENDGNFDLTVKGSADGAVFDVSLYTAAHVASLQNITIECFFPYAEITVTDTSSAPNDITVVVRPFDKVPESGGPHLLSAFVGYPSTVNGCLGIAKENFGDVDLYVLSFPNTGTKYAQWTTTANRKYNSISVDILWTYITGSGATVKWNAGIVVPKAGDNLNMSYLYTTEILASTLGANKEHVDNIIIPASGENGDFINLRIGRISGEDAFNGVAKIFALKVLFQ